MSEGILIKEDFVRMLKMPLVYIERFLRKCYNFIDYFITLDTFIIQSDELQSL